MGFFLSLLVFFIETWANVIHRETLSKHMSRRLNKECKRRRTVRMEREDLEATYNRVHYDSCEISRKLSTGPGDGKKLNDYVFNNLLSQRAIQDRINSRF